MPNRHYMVSLGAKLLYILGVIMTSLAPFLAGLAVSYLLYKYIIYPTYLSPLAKIPAAHWSARISPAWILYIRWSWQENRTIHAAHGKHGSVVRLGPNELSVNCVDDGIRSIYAGGYEKHQWYPNLFKNYDGYAFSLVIFLYDPSVL